MASDDRLRELEEKYEDYKVYDNQGSKIGKVDDLFVDETDREEYIGVKLGLFGMRSTLIPMEIVRVNETDRTIEVAESKDRVKDAPNFDDDDDITSEYEERIRSHFGLEASASSTRGSQEASSTEASDTATAGADTESSTSETGEHEDHAQAEHDVDEDEDHTAEHPAHETGHAEHEGEHHGETTETAGSEHGEAADGVSGDDTAEHQYEEHRDEEPAGHRDEEHGSGTGEGAGSEGARFGEDATPGTPVSRQTEETETFEEDGETKIRRRIVREEVEEPDESTGSSR